MTPVINPWVFYWMPLCDVVKDTCSAIGWMCLIAAIAVTIVCLFESSSYYKNENFLKDLKSIKKILFPIAIAFVLIGTFTPSEKTITKMLIAQNVTYERVEVATDTVETVYNDIMHWFDKSSDSNG
jgi:Na+-transporting methylmalonyl-CoA/oxaloacetate decarboxylase beta subunit